MLVAYEGYPPFSAEPNGPGYKHRPGSMGFVLGLNIGLVNRSAGSNPAASTWAFPGPHF
jgi:hypothetical protein